MGIKQKLLRLYARCMRRLRRGERIWLYIDRLDGTDNALYQLQHDLQQRDRVKRYYVHGSREVPGLAAKHVLLFGSMRHKLLHLRCEKVLASFGQHSLIHPFSKAAMAYFRPAAPMEVIYLQHGVLHAKLPQLYHRSHIPCDRVVISTQFEQRNMTAHYGFSAHDLIPTGMARYDFLRPEQPPQRRILFAPSWRQNLVGELHGNRREPLFEAYKASQYYKQAQAFLASPRLAEFLERYDLTLDVQSHPIFRCYDGLFSFGSPRIHLGGAPDLNPYQLMITDYSSIALDFVYLQRPLLYFVPDYADFLAGNTHSYSELHIPLEQAFGPLAQTQEALLAALEASAQRSFAPEPLYAQRMEGFFISRQPAHRKALYDVLFEQAGLK